MVEDKKENFRMEIVKKDLIFAAIHYVLPTIDVSHMRIWNCEIVYFEHYNNIRTFRCFTY